MAFFAMQLAFPVMKSTLFFASPSSNDTGEAGLLSIFVPTNPFRALSEDSLLATVLFSLFLAIGLIGNVKSGSFIQQLSAIQGVFHRINDIIMRTVPPEILNHGTCDIIMSPATVTSKRLDDMKFSGPYTVPCMAFVLKDERRWEFSSLGTVKRMECLKVAALNNSDLFNYAKTLLLKATIVGLDSLEDFFQGNRAEAFITTAEGASTMTQLQLHPFYGVAKIGPKLVANHQIIYAYPMAIDRGDAFMAQLNYWLKMQESGVALPRKYNYWILGGNAQEEAS